MTLQEALEKEAKKIKDFNIGGNVIMEDYTDFICRKHGGPFDRGSADAYYGRMADPHKYSNGTCNGPRITLIDREEIDLYMFGYNNETDRNYY